MSWDVYNFKFDNKYFHDTKDVLDDIRYLNNAHLQQMLLIMLLLYLLHCSQI